MSVADELSKLKSHLESGLLSEAEYARAKQRLLDGAPPVAAAVNSFRRSASDKWIAGICGGLAVSTGVESWVWRLILTVLLLFGGTGFILYVLLWIFVPTE